jgi:hypothetical protein
MDSWYLVDDSSGAPVTTGPFTIEQLRDMVAGGRVRGDSLVAAVGTSDWIAAASDPRLRTLFDSMSWGAPPQVPPPAAVAASPSEYGFVAAFQLGWSSFTKRWGSWMLLSLVFLAVALVVQLPQQVLTMLAPSVVRSGGERAATQLMVGAFCVGLVMQIFVGMPLFSGLVYAAARMYRGEGRISDIFEGFRRYGTAVTSGIMLMLVYVGCGVVAYVPMLILFMTNSSGIRGAGAGLAPWLLGCFAVTVVIGLILMATIVMRVLFAPVLAIDPAYGHPGAMEAFRMAWRQTGTRGLSMMALMFVAAAIVVLSLLLFCIGYVLVGLPLFIAIIGAMYQLLYRPERTVPMGAP